MDRISSRELDEWAALGVVEPWGQDREDIRAAIIWATLVNTHIAKASQAVKPEQFIQALSPQPEPTEQGSAEVLLAKTMARFATIGGQG